MRAPIWVWLALWLMGFFIVYGALTLVIELCQLALGAR